MTAIEYRKKKTFDEGIVYFEAALKIQNNNFYALYGLADCYRGLAMHQESLHAWKHLLSLSPNNKVIMTRLADSYRNLGDLEDAESYYTSALDIDYDYYAVLGLSYIYKERKNFTKAITLLKDAFARDPANKRSLYELALCYNEAGSYNEALEILQEYMAHGFNSQSILDFQTALQEKV